jgi:hypothetical protein
MPETSQIVFSHKELVELMLKQQGIHEGIWGIFVKFSLGASNVGPTQSDLLPAAIVAINEIGLQKFEQETNISVDAAKINPKVADTAKK